MKKLLKGLKRFATARRAGTLPKIADIRGGVLFKHRFTYNYFFARTLSNLELTCLSDPKYACFKRLGCLKR